MKPVRLSRHARENITFRGATEEEVVEAIRHAEWEAAEWGRYDCRREFPFGQDWNGHQYSSNRSDRCLWTNRRRLWS